MIMFWQKKEFQEAYFDTLNNFFKFNKRTHFFEIDFSKPWWYTILKRKFRYIFLVSSEVLQATFESLVPLGFGIAISQQKMEYLTYIIFGYIGLEIINRLAVYSNGLTIAEVQGSIALEAQNFFLTVDPIFHSTKSSGAIVSKMQAGGREFIMMMNMICFQIIPTVISYITVTLTLIYFNGYLGLVSVTFFILITLLTSFFRYINSNSLVKKWIGAREKYAAITTENLIQNSHIRSTFATIETIQRTEKLVRNAYNTRNIMFMGGAMVTFFARMLYIVSVFVIGYGILDLVQKGVINSVIGTTVIITYMSGSRQILRIGDTVGDVTESMANIADLFQFITNFGKQSFPVLSGDTIDQIQ
ncbi:MAG: ABC transporter ATP-binding protein [candidate division SR1 bacterium]|nr:ABC transporter ATP-binding protein [candidate division SR1 bacterium]